MGPDDAVSLYGNDRRGLIVVVDEIVRHACGLDTVNPAPLGSRRAERRVRTRQALPKTVRQAQRQIAHNGRVSVAVVPPAFLDGPDGPPPPPWLRTVLSECPPCAS